MPLYSGSHTASYEALLNHKVEAGELNSQVIEAATLAGQYDPKDFVVLWQSQADPAGSDRGLWEAEPGPESQAHLRLAAPEAHRPDPG